MKRARPAAILFLVLAGLACLFAECIAPAGYSCQFRDIPDAASSRQHWLGTDDLGRDRFARLVYGTRVSLALAPAAALLSTGLAALIGGAAGLAGGWIQSCLMSATDLVLSLPWFFLLITARALLPLNVDPHTSVAITFALLGCLGWAGAARVVAADARSLCGSEMVLLARATGIRPLRLLLRHILPNLRTVLSAQFWLSIPVFILAEANLGVLGLGVSEPLPSWGSLLRELESFTTLSPRPWHFAPLLLLILTVSSFHLAFEKEESWA
jgi:peptide/nickel transport system permease protein